MVLSWHFTVLTWYDVDSGFSTIIVITRQNFTLVSAWKLQTKKVLYPKPASEPPSPSMSRCSTPAVSDDDDEHKPVKFDEDDNPTDDEDLEPEADQKN